MTMQVRIYWIKKAVLIRGAWEEEGGVRALDRQQEIGCLSFLLQGALLSSHSPTRPSHTLSTPHVLKYQHITTG